MFVIAPFVCVMIMAATNKATVTSTCPYKLVTFNTGLVHTIPKAEQRKEKLMSTLQDMDSDVVCLQEVWFATDVIDIVRSVETVFPFTYSALHGSDGKLDLSSWHYTPCSWWNMRSFRCLVSQCGTTKPYAEILACGITQCNLWKDISQQCVMCALISGFAGVFQRCFGSVSTHMNEPGLLLLSKRPLRNREVVPFIPNVKQLFPRSMLNTNVERIGTVSCNHLSTNIFRSSFFEPELQERFSSFEEENAFETQSIIDYYQDKDKVIVMGDLNTGPQIEEKNIAGDIPESFDIFKSNGYISPYVEMVGEGTYTAGNPYTVESFNVIRDHVLYKGAYRSVAAKRVFDETIEIIGGPLSDHYGVEVILEADGTNPI